MIFLNEKLNFTKAIALAMTIFGAALTANPQGGEWRGSVLAWCAAGHSAESAGEFVNKNGERGGARRWADDRVP